MRIYKKLFLSYLVLIKSTLPVLRLEYSGHTRSIQELLIPWLLAVPGNQQPLHWLYTMTVLMFPDGKVHVANMGPTWGRQDPCGPHVGHMNIAIWIPWEGIPANTDGLLKKCNSIANTLELHFFCIKPLVYGTSVSEYAFEFDIIQCYKNLLTHCLHLSYLVLKNATLLVPRLIFWAHWINSIETDTLSPCSARSSATIILILYFLDTPLHSSTCHLMVNKFTNTLFLSYLILMI